MSTLKWNMLSAVHSLDDVKVVAKSNGVCQCRISNLQNSTKYLFKCGQYRKYPLCNYELQAVVPDDDSNSITIVFRNTHNHEIRTETSRVPSPIRQSVAKYVHNGLTESQIDFLVWQESCWLVTPLESCTCPVGLKTYTCKHSVGLAILFNLYQVNDQTRIEPLGKRKDEGGQRKFLQRTVNSNS